MKVLYFARAYTTHDHRFLRSLAEAGCQTSFLRLTEARLDTRPLPAGVSEIAWVGTSRPLGSLTDLATRARALPALLREAAPDVVLAGPVPTSAYLVALARRRRLVAMSWGSDVLVEAEQSARIRRVTRFTLRRAAGALGDCEAVRAKLETFGVSPDRIVAFPWGIDLGQFAPGPTSLPLRAELGWAKDDPVLISVRTWEPIYAIDVLVNAFARLRARMPQARLVLLGDGSEAPRIRALVAALGLAAHVHAPGRIPYAQQPEFFRLADVYVSSALSDGTSISLLEAMACGLPAVVTRGYGNLEWVSEGDNGWLAAPGDVADLAARLEDACRDRARLRAFGRRNVTLARQKADWSANFPRLLALFDRVMQDRATP